jgi:hypothetical protein
MKTRFSTCFRKPDFKCLPKTRYHRTPQNLVSQDSPKADFTGLLVRRVRDRITFHWMIGTHHNVIRRLHYNHKHCGPVRIRPRHMVDSSKVCVHLVLAETTKIVVAHQPHQARDPQRHVRFASHVACEVAGSLHPVVALAAFSPRHCCALSRPSSPSLAVHAATSATGQNIGNLSTILWYGLISSGRGGVIFP